MDEGRLTSYVARRIALNETFMNGKTHYNGHQLNYRSIFYRLSNRVREFIDGHGSRWVILPGLRGIGKTTVMAQLGEYIKGLDDQAHVIYFSLDDMLANGFNLRDLLDEYFRQVQIVPEQAQRNVFVMLDEVQYDKKWAMTVKGLSDVAPGVFFICSGSSAVSLQTNADVAGRRADIEKMYAMDFSEYELIKNGVQPNYQLSRSITSALFDSASADEGYRRLSALEVDIDQYYAWVGSSDWEQYVKGGSIPFALDCKDENELYTKISQSMDKVLDKDLPQMSSLDDKSVGIARMMVRALATADTVSVNSLADTYGVSRPTIASILDSLCRAELLIHVYPYGSNYSIAKKDNKYLFASPVMRAAIQYLNGYVGDERPGEGHLLEDLVGLYLYKRNNARMLGDLYYDSTSGGADFIVRTGFNESVVMEVGRGDKGSNQVDTTMSRVSNAKYGLTISRTNQIRLSSNRRSIFVPWRVMALAG